MRAVSTLLFFCLLGCAATEPHPVTPDDVPLSDRSAPVFAGGAQLAVTQDCTGPWQKRVEWPAATDDRGISGYRVLLDGRQVASVAPSETHAIVEVRGARGGRYVVRAFDAAGNATELEALVPSHTNVGCGQALDIMNQAVGVGVASE